MNTDYTKNTVAVVLKYCLMVLVAMSLSACVSLPDNVQPVQGFQLQRYLGKWYEIARLDHSFERGLEQVSAEYTLRDDGGITVSNQGWHSTDKQWHQAAGKAYFVRNSNEAYLKVSFFGPFYGAYIIFELDKDDYQYAFVSGPNKSYLWLLTRTPTINEKLRNHFIKSAENLGFDTDKLIFVAQNN